MNFFQKIVVLAFCSGLVLGVVEPLWAIGQDVVTDDEVPYYNVEAHQDYMYDPVPAPESATRVKQLGGQQSTVNSQQSTVPEPVEGRTRRFDRLSDRKAQSSEFRVQSSLHRP